MFTQDRPRFNARSGLGIVLDHRVNNTILLLLLYILRRAYRIIIIIIVYLSRRMDRIISVTRTQ